MRVWSNQPQNQHTLKWLSNRLSDILEYKTYKPEDSKTRSKNKMRPMTAQEVFSLMAKPPHRGGGRHAGTAENVAIWLRAAELRGYSSTEAVQLACNVFKRDRVSINRYKRYGSELAAGLNLKALAKLADDFKHIGKPLPPPKA